MSPPTCPAPLPQPCAQMIVTGHAEVRWWVDGVAAEPPRRRCARVRCERDDDTTRRARNLENCGVGRGTHRRACNFARPGGGATVETPIAALARHWRSSIDVHEEDGGDHDTALMRNGKRSTRALSWSHRCHFDSDSAAAVVVDWERGVASGREPLAVSAHEDAHFLGRFASDAGT